MNSPQFQNSLYEYTTREYETKSGQIGAEFEKHLEKEGWSVAWRDVTREGAYAVYRRARRERVKGGGSIVSSNPSECGPVRCTHFTSKDSALVTTSAAKRITHETVLYGAHDIQRVGQARLETIVSADGEEMGRVTILAGPRDDVVAYLQGGRTLAEIRKAWGVKETPTSEPRELSKTPVAERITHKPFIHDMPSRRGVPQARLEVTVLHEGVPAGNIILLSGPKADILGYLEGHMSLADVQKAWGVRLPKDY